MKQTMTALEYLNLYDPKNFLVEINNFDDEELFIIKGLNRAKQFLEWYKAQAVLAGKNTQLQITVTSALTGEILIDSFALDSF